MYFSADVTSYLADVHINRERFRVERTISSVEILALPLAATTELVTGKREARRIFRSH